jgi:hypothetical protein
MTITASKVWVNMPEIHPFAVTFHCCNVTGMLKENSILNSKIVDCALLGGHRNV